MGSCHARISVIWCTLLFVRGLPPCALRQGADVTRFIPKAQREKASLFVSALYAGERC